MVSKCKRCFLVFVGPLNIEAPAREVTNNSLTDFDLPSVSKGKHFAISISLIKGCNIMPVCIVTFPKRQKANIPDLEKLKLFWKWRSRNINAYYLLHIHWQGSS